MAEDLSLVRAGIPEMDDCKILTRLKAFLVDQGVVATLEHTFRDKKGNPRDLSDWLASSSSESGSASSSVAPAGVVKCRIKAWLGTGPSPRTDPIWDVYGDAYDAQKGVVRATLESDIVEHPGIYEMTWAVVNDRGIPVVVDRGLLSVEKSMFPVLLSNLHKDLGPPSIQEVRMRLMDSSKNENLLLDDIEFKDEQILLAMAEPVRFWNETPPPIRPLYTTRNFPFRGAWITGVLGQLHLTMANHFRRNVFQGAAGGTSDKAKEREYMGEGMRLWEEYKSWVHNKKVEINLKGFVGHVSSQYATGGW